MGTNEKKYAWMDEGMVVMLPLEYQRRGTDGYDRLPREVKSYQRIAGHEMDFPLITPSVMMRGPALRIASYSKPAIAYVILEEMMGKEKFREAMKLYIDRWNGKHPTPYDFFYTFNQVHGESLNWFWDSWFFSRGYPDLGIDAVVDEGKKTKVVIKKIGAMPAPVSLKVVYADSSEQIIRKSAEVWKNKTTQYDIVFEPLAEIHSIELGSETIPDINTENNIYSKKSVTAR
jgi:hypothetical protein